MIETSKIISKKTEINRNNLASKIQKSPFYRPLSSTVDQVFSLQRIIRNQAVQTLLKSGVIQTKLRIGQPNDMYEKEADRVADW